MSGNGRPFDNQVRGPTAMLRSRYPLTLLGILVGSGCSQPELAQPSASGASSLATCALPPGADDPWPTPNYDRQHWSRAGDHDAPFGYVHEAEPKCLRDVGCNMPQERIRPCGSLSGVVPYDTAVRCAEAWDGHVVLVRGPSTVIPESETLRACSGCCATLTSGVVLGNADGDRLGRSTLRLEGKLTRCKCDITACCCAYDQPAGRHLVARGRLHKTPVWTWLTEVDLCEEP
jgi:hypothetical protein